jgi:uncharacterized caspase-like protein
VPCHDSAAADAIPSRLAVVIANAAYSALGTLQNPVADGRLVATSLRNAGFTVRSLENLTDEQFRTALREIARDSAKADVTLVYYAGHGVQIGGINYLIPVDLTSPQGEEDVRLASVSADDVLYVMHSPYKVLILDACRDDPILSRSLSRGRGISFKRGLARIAPQADSSGGVFVAYSTESDAIADDGKGANSPFAESFAKYVGERVSIDDMFAMVTRDVLKQTKGAQRPFKYASLDTVFCLPGDCASAVSTTPAIAQIRPTVQTPPSPAGSSADVTAVIDAFKRLNATRSADTRAKIEQGLWEQLKAFFPPLLAAGTEETAPDGTVKAWGIEAARVSSDGHKALVTDHPGQLKDRVFTFDESIGTDKSIDCDHHMWSDRRNVDGSDVKLFSQAEQKANLKAIIPTSVLAGLARLFCEAPLRLTPLWIVDRLSWTDIGFEFAAALSVRYKDPASNDIWYLLTKVPASDQDQVGSAMIYEWIGINCRTHLSASNQSMSLDKNGRLVYFFAPPMTWRPFKDASASANAQVILCDR